MAMLNYQRVLSLGFILLRLPQKWKLSIAFIRLDAEAITIDEIRRHLESKPVQQFFRQAWHLLVGRAPKKDWNTLNHPRNWVYFRTGLGAFFWIWMIDFFCTARFREQSHFKSIIIWSWPRTIDVDSSEAEVLFEILDLSGDGSIDKEDRPGGPQTGLWARNDSDKKPRSVSLKLFGTWLKNQHLWWHFGQRIILRPWLIWNICLEFSVYRIIEMDMAQTPLPVQLGGIQVVWLAILYPQHHLAMQPSFPHHFPIIFPAHLPNFSQPLGPGPFMALRSRRSSSAAVYGCRVQPGPWISCWWPRTRAEVRRYDVFSCSIDDIHLMIF